VVEDRVPIPRTLLHPRWLLFQASVAVPNWQPSYTGNLQIQQLVIKLPTAVDRGRLAMLRIVDALEDLNHDEQERYLVAIELWSAKLVSSLQECLAVRNLPHEAFEVPMKPKWVKPNAPEEPVPLSIENEALNVAGEGSKSLLKKPAYSRAKSFKLQVRRRLPQELYKAIRVQEPLDICLNTKPIAYQEQEVEGSKVVTSGDVASVGGVEEISAQPVQVTSEMPTIRETRPSTPYFLPKPPKIDPSSPSEAYLSEGSQESNWHEESEVLPYKPAEPSRRDGLRTNRRRLNLAAQPTIRTNKKPAATTPKKPKLNIERIGGKTKKRRERDLTGSPKKTMKSPEAKRAKGKKYREEGHRVSARTYDALELDWSLGV
jgi:hypothetical protein